MPCIIQNKHPYIHFFVCSINIFDNQAFKILPKSIEKEECLMPTIKKNSLGLAKKIVLWLARMLLCVVAYTFSLSTWGFRGLKDSINQGQHGIPTTY